MCLNRLVPEAKQQNQKTLLLCNNAGNVHTLFAPFLVKLHKPFGVHIHGSLLFSHVHLAEFNFLPLPSVTESSLEAKKKDAVGLSSKVLPRQYQVIAWHMITS